MRARRSLNNPKIGAQGEAVELSADQVRVALDKVVTSDVFRGSRRLQDFLKYVVEHSLSGRGEKIPAKLISQDVYERSIDVNADNENVVRVDAGRLRRRLEQYYLDAGKNDPVRIHMDPRGYAPRFEDRNNVAESIFEQPLKRRRMNMVVTFTVGAMLVAGIVYLSNSSQTDQRTVGKESGPPEAENASQDLRVLERQAILEKSPAALQAVNLAEQARGLIFPIFDVERLKLTTEMFRQAIHLDDEYFGGYAGAAQTLGTLVLFRPPGAERNALQAEAQYLAEKALSLDPTHSWTQSAVAWVAFSGRDYDGAIRLSNRALNLSPDDGNVLDFHALISLFSGDFESARDAANPDRVRTASKQRFAHRNMYGAANFHLGNYATTIASFNAAAERGDPVSAPSLAYLAAAHHAMGDMDGARRKVEQLASAWPEFRADLVLKRFYRHREHADAVLNRLFAAGWMPPTKSETGTSAN